MDYISPFLVNPMGFDPGTQAWYFAREAYVASGRQEDYERMLALVTSSNPLLAWELEHLWCGPQAVRQRSHAPGVLASAR